ncbi:caspase domain-containing protein [Russula emetica]|nr:caspase domain-containing protein [Russula emetica]
MVTHSSPVPTFCPRRRPVPNSLPSPLNTGLSSLTSSLASHTRRLGNLLRRLTCSSVRLADIEEGLPSGNMVVPAAEGTAQVAQPSVQSGRRRALLIGISYRGELLNTHQDVDRYRNVLIVNYGYRPEDITVLKDDPAFAIHLQPTRENILRELKNLVANAAAGDRFTFLYSGHSNQQPSKDLNEEDFLDEYLITIDDEIIIDNELNDILVKPLPAGSSLFALLDTCHSGTLLDLPHYYCNSVYFPWRSKGKRRTNSWQNVTVRRNAAFIQDPFLPDPSPRPSPGISSILAQSKHTEGKHSVLPIFVSIPLSTDRRVAPAPMEVAARHLRDYNLLSSPRFCASPTSRLACDGWCKPDPNTNAPTVSLAACSDNQRSWETYDGSLTRIVCSFLEQNQRPSYKDLMTHINFKLHTSALQLHEWTRSEKMKLKEQAVAEMAKEKPAQAQGDPCSEEKALSAEGEVDETFEGEMDNFQTPLLSSLVPLDMQDVLQV